MNTRSNPATPACLRPLRASDRDMVFRWRNSDEVRRFMFNSAPIRWDDHCNWFAKTCESASGRFFIFEWNGTPVGTVSFKDAEQGESIVSWGFYVAPGHEHCGYGSIMGFMALDLAFRTLSLSKVIGEVLDFNQRSAEYHRKLGFQQADSRRAVVDGKTHDVLVFHLSAEEWQSARDVVRFRVTKGKTELAWL